MPYYIAGPHDEPRRVIAALERTVGRGGYHFIVPAKELIGSDGCLYAA
ncbi:MAG: hypothetical protein ACRDMX_07295 [Solirubrobacteraceae bacterium]